jgi:tetratricopeptide (TPR) repeat protein
VEAANAPPELLGELARAYIRRYQATGEPGSLASAREVGRRALEAGSTSADRAKALNVCGAVAMLEYEHVGDIELLREAVAAFRKARDLDPADPLAAGQFGAAVWQLAQWEDDGALLDVAIDALRVAVAANDGERAVRLNNLGAALSTRCASSQDLTDAAIALQGAIELTEPDSPDAAARWNNLGTVRLRTHQRIGGAPMLDAAIDAFKKAMDAMPAADPAWPGRAANLAAALARRGTPEDRAHSTELHRQAAAGEATDPDDALLAAANWCRSAFAGERWEETTEAYERALAISDMLLERQLTDEARRARLRVVQWRPELAAFAWGRRDDALAVARTLEAGRARLLADALEPSPPSPTPELAARHAHAVREVEVAERALEDAPSAAREHAVANVRRRRAELAAVAAELGATVPDPLATMSRVARERPLVYVAYTPAGSVAAVVHGDPLAAQLVFAPELGAGAVDLTSVGALTSRLAPLLEGHDGVTFSLPAALSHVPLAAAPCGGGMCLADRHAITLLPSAAAAAPERAATAAPRLGGVANPARTDVTTLRYAAVELRAAGADVAAHNEDLLPQARATVDGVLSVVGRCTHLHFACHGRFRPEEPLESALLLTDGELSVRRIQRADRSADLRLLVLSACESAQTDADVLPDEMIGLPTAFLRIGARAVIGALWPIPDLPTAILMARFYRELAAFDDDAAGALRAAQSWFRRAMPAELAAFLTELAASDPDVALLAAGARAIERAYAPDVPPFAEPAVWAAFVVYGAGGGACPTG